MEALLSNYPEIIDDDSAISHLAFRAYRMADEMERQAMHREAMQREAQVQEERTKHE